MTGVHDINNTEDLNFNFSDEQLKLFGTNVPFNTNRNSKTCTNLFCLFYCRKYEILVPKLLKEFEHRQTPVYRRRSLRDIIWIETRHHLFGYPGEKGRLLPTDVSLWPRVKLAEINSVLIKFVEEYRKKWSKSSTYYTEELYIRIAKGIQCLL